MAEKIKYSPPDLNNIPDAPKECRAMVEISKISLSSGKNITTEAACPLFGKCVVAYYQLTGRPFKIVGDSCVRSPQNTSH